MAASIWLPNIEEFFVSLTNLIVDTASRDSVDFFGRRLDEHERTLAVLTLRIGESFPNRVYVINDLRQLLSILHELKLKSTL